MLHLTAYLDPVLHRLKFAWAVAAALFLAFALAQPALAHTRVEIGPYTLVLGWLKEPVIVGERNALTLEVSEGETPVEGLEGTLEVAVFYGGETFLGQLAPTATPGLYTVEIFPTIRGQYEVQLTGTIGDEAVDEVVEPEAVLPANVLQFPEEQPDPNELSAELAELRAEQDGMRTTLTLAITAGSAGLVLGGLALIIAFRNKQQPGARAGAEPSGSNDP